MVHDELKKWLIRFSCEMKYGCAYVYIRPSVDDAPYRFYFNIAGSSRMWKCVKFWKKRGFLVNIWRPPVLPLS